VRGLPGGLEVAVAWGRSLRRAAVESRSSKGEGWATCPGGGAAILGGALEYPTQAKAGLEWAARPVCPVSSAGRSFLVLESPFC
jgi:hypothetical protein